MSKIYYYIYETTNLINGKTYIGQHITKDLNDGYMGSGAALKTALKKYGKQNFRREILLFAVNEIALNFIEKCLVTDSFINDHSNYNLKTGGGSSGLYSQLSKTKMSAKAKLNKIGHRNPAYKYVSGELLTECQNIWVKYGKTHLIKFLKKRHNMCEGVASRLIRSFRKNPLLNNERLVNFKKNMGLLMKTHTDKLHKSKKSNPRYNHTILNLSNIKTNEIFYGTRNDFFTKYGFQLHGRFLSKVDKTCKGWEFIV